MLTLYTKLTGHELTIIDELPLASGSVAFDRVHFDFDGAWTDLSCVALFWGTLSDDPYAAIVDSSGYATVPYEVLQEKSKIKFGVYGTEAGQTTPRMTSTLLKYRVPEGAWSDSINNSGTPTASLIEQFEAAATSAINSATAVANSADAAVKAICPAVTVGPSAIVTVTDAVPLTLDALSVGISDANGVSSVTVTRTSKNVLQLPASGVDGELTFTRESDGTLSISGTASKNVTYYINRYSTGRSLYGDYIVTVVGTAYTGDGWLYITKADQSGSASRYVGGVTGANISVRCAEGIGNLYLYIPKNSVISESHLQIMVRPASISDDTFEAYNGQSATIALGRTVTEGTLDVLNGKLTVSDTTYDVTAQQVTMLDGANAVWADCGDTTLTYRANPYLKLLALINSYHPAQQLSVQTLSAPTQPDEEPVEDESR